MMKLMEFFFRGKTLKFPRVKITRLEIEIGTWRFRARDFLAIVNLELYEKRTGAT